MLHEIIGFKFTLPPMLVEALFHWWFLLIGYIANLKIGYLVKLSRHLKLCESGDTSSWCSIVVSWHFANDLDTNNLPPLGYNHETDKMLISHEDHNKVIRQELWKIYTQHQWINPLEPLSSKMLYYKEHFALL